MRYDEYFSNVVYNLIGNTLIAETIAAATAIAKKYPHAFRIVTLDGDVISTSGSMTGGSRREGGSNFLANERRIEETRADIAAAEKEKASLTAAKAEAEQKRDRASAAFETLREGFQEAKSRRAALLEKRDSLAARIAENEEAHRAQEEAVGLLHARLQEL